MSDDTKNCYQCGALCGYLFADGRCKDCTRQTPEEVAGGTPAPAYDVKETAAGIANVHKRVGDKAGCAAYRNAVRHYGLDEAQAMALDIEVAAICMGTPKQ